MKVIILAGGVGSRITEETVNIPKPMIKVNGVPIIELIMEHYSNYGHHEFIVLGGYKYDILNSYFKGSTRNVTCVDTGLETFTGGRLAKAKDLIGDETFMLTYGDGVSDVDINSLLQFHKSQGSIGTVTAINPTERFGILNIGTYNTVINFKEKCKSVNYINGGFFVFETAIFDYIEGNVMLEQEPLNALAQDGELKAYKHHGFWKCMDTLKDKNELEEYYDAKRDI